ncbi:MAG: Nramp family divalent metal transporter [Cyclobacteriaceae bacterium]|nr:Nramp family divalent metal transporter [Cyclobacteriaceae bacterium]
MSNLSIRKILVAFSAVGPGLFLIAYNIGTGSIITMAKAGAEYGMTLFWALVLSCIFTYVLMIGYGQVTLISGKTSLHNIKMHIPRFGKPLALYIIVALIIGELLALMGIMGIVADLLQEAISMLTGGVLVSTLSITTVLIVLLSLLLWNGQYQMFEKLLSVLVVLMILCFLYVFIAVKPDLNEILSGLMPSIPNQPGSLGLIAAMAGTTCSAAVFVIRSIVVSEKGWDASQLKTEKKDAFVSSLMMLFLSGIIMAVAAGTLHVMGLRVTDTVELIQLFEPIGGKFAAIVLIAGITGAALSTVFPIVLIAPWLISDYSSRPRDIRSPLFRTLGLLGLCFGFGLQFVDERPPAMMVFSQAFQAFILPAVTIPILILMENKSVMKNTPISVYLKIGVWCVLLFGILTSYLAIVEFVN